MQVKNKTHFFKDVIHGEIVLREQWAMDLIKCVEFVRLTRIKQLGLTYRLYPNATHTRFAHSLGVYDLANRLIKQFDCFNKNEANELAAAALVHDFGHGPHSHAFEHYTQVEHEKYSKAIVLDPNTEVNKILLKYKINPQHVCDILDHKHSNHILNDLISSQIDVDRMDYLARDSHFSGACYGAIDISMMIRWMLIHNGKVCFNAKAVSSIENFLLARYHMFNQVYEQPKTVAVEQLIRKMLKRFKTIFQKNRKKIVDKYHMVKFFLPWLEGKTFSVEQYIKIDDVKFEMFIDQMQFEKDPYIKEAFELYSHFGTDDYQVVPFNKTNLQKYTNQFKNTTKYPGLYIHKCLIKTKPIYKKDEEKIWIYDDVTDHMDTLENKSIIIKKIMNATKPLNVLVINKKI